MSLNHYLILCFVGLAVTICSAKHYSGMDEARLKVTVESTYRPNDTIIIAGQNTDCWNCSFIKLCSLPAISKANCSHDHPKLYSNHSTILKVSIMYNGTTRLVCPQLEPLDVVEHAEYGLVIKNLGSGNVVTDSEQCDLMSLKPGQDSYLPILYMFVALVGVSLLWIISKNLHKHGCFDRCLNRFNKGSEALIRADLGSTNGSPEESFPADNKPRRLVSLDAFRGLSLTIMIFVNYGGGGYWFFAHSSWNGLTVADLVFPWFVFIMGTAVAIVFNSNHKKEKSKISMFYVVVVRSIKLFILGLMVNSTGATGNDLANLRIPGVLQRFSITYLVVATTELIFSSGYKKHMIQEGKWYRRLTDVVLFWPNWTIALFCGIAHAIVTFLVPYDMNNCPTGFIGPGGISGDPATSHCTGGIAKFIDVKVFGPQHIYQHGTCLKLYMCNNTDPEGLLGTLTSIFICFLGVQAGRIFVVYTSPKARVSRLIVWSLITGLIGLLLCGAQQNTGWIPMNKNLWSLSFVLVLGGMAYLLLAVMYLLIDVAGIWTGAPLFYPGMNSIFIYMGSEVMEQLVPVSFAVSHTHLAQLFINLWSVTFWVLLSAYMHYKGIFISV